MMSLMIIPFNHKSWTTHPIRYVQILLAITAIMVGLVSLGMKLPDLPGVSSSSHPKPRPRAVIVKQAQITKKVCKAQGFHLAPSGLSPSAVLMLFAVSAVFPLCSRLPFPPSFSRHWRAPPRAPAIYA